MYLPPVCLCLLRYLNQKRSFESENLEHYPKMHRNKWVARNGLPSKHEDNGGIEESDKGIDQSV